MKKYTVSILVASVFLIGTPFLAPKVSAADLNIRDFINLLVAIGVITPDRMPAVNAFLATLNNNQTTNTEITHVQTSTAITYPAINSTATQLSIPISIVDESQTNANNEVLTRISIKGLRTNTPVKYWKLSYFCPAGVIFDTEKGSGIICDGTSAQNSHFIIWASQIDNIASDYLVVKGVIKNNNTFSSQVEFVLEAFNYNNSNDNSKPIGKARDILSLPAREQITTPDQPLITVLTPNAGDIYHNNNSPRIEFSWKSNYPTRTPTYVYLIKEGSDRSAEMGKLLPEGSTGTSDILTTNSVFSPGQYIIKICDWGTDDTICGLSKSFSINSAD